MSTEPASDSSNTFTDEAQEATYKYRCPLCGVVYDNELVTRIHVSWSDDTDHLNYNGLMPEIEVEVIDDDNELVEKLSRRPQDIDLTTLTVDDLPDEKSEQHKQILLAAANNPHETTYSELETDVAQRLETHNLEPVSYSTIRRVVQSYYQPQQSDTKTNSENEELESLTSKQQAIVLARLSHPDKSAAKIAEKIGCAPSYPPQVYEKANSVLNQLAERVANNEDLVEICREELTEASIKDLVERELVQNLNIDLEDVARDQSTENRDQWGSPVDDHDVMTANPGDGSFEDSTRQTTVQELDKHSNGDSPNDVSSETLAAGEQITEEAVPPAEIAALRDRVAFVRRIFARASDSDSSDIAAVVALAEQIETLCDDLLDDT